MSEVTSEIGIAAKIIDCAEHGDIQEVENAWIELAANPPAAPDFYVQFFRRMRKHHEVEKAHSLVLLALETMANREDWSTLLKVIEEITHLWPESPEIRKYASRSLKGLHGSNPNFSQMIALCKGLPLGEALKRFKSLTLMAPGEVYWHVYWGEGVVKTIDFSTSKISLEFPTEDRTLALDFFKKHLTYLEPDSFLARRRINPEGLRAQAEESPAEIVRLALQQKNGTMTQGDLKQFMINGVIPEEKWNSWWTKARHEIHIDPMIDFDAKGGARAELRLRSKPKSVEEEVEELFLAEDASMSDRIEAVQMLVTANKAGSVSSETVERLLTFINGEFMLKTAMPLLDRLNYAFLRDDLTALVPDLASKTPDVSPTRDIVNEIDNYQILRGVDQADHGPRAFKMLIERDGDAGAEQAAALLPVASSKLAPVIWKQLEGEEHLQAAVQGLRTLLDDPLENPDTYAWACRNLLEKKWPHLEDHIPVSGIVPDLVDNVDNWHHMVEKGSGDREKLAAAKSLLGKLRSLLQARNFGPLCEAAEEMTADQFAALRNRIAISDAFTSSFKQTADHQLQMTRRDLQKAPPAPAPGSAPAEGELHFCTPKARELKLEELRDLNTVKLPNIAKEIEKARAEGDLKENAGYIYAKEQQKLLMQASLSLQTALQTARIFPREKLSTETISFGVAFEAENLKSGATEKYTVLGRFETDPDKNILSYQAPFMLPFAGKKVGEEVEVKHPGGGETRYKILAITDALASGEWEHTTNE